ncbi:general secretion pathway protein M [Methylorubrum rhodinum]|uniref:General secretion pathway protein M n=1 Tax=Methylorubrum rhodinum TaxID=29428 RepID=A0A840ZJW6_9HYPH|nr:type II secretion system protein GspM [Methylorubrum rhodinum]MBB5757846.1 general secretion pathway protein M [Methylorubrum rhodinum]
MSADPRVSPPLRRWLGPIAVAVFVGLPLLLAALTLDRLAAWWDASDAVEESRTRIGQIEARIRRLAVEQARLREGRGEGGGEGDVARTRSVFLDAAAPGLARAEMQRRLSALVDAAGGRLIEVRGEDEADDGRTVLLRASLDIGNDGLFDLLARIEAGMPLLTVESINIRTQAGRAAAADDPQPTLRVALALRGHRREGRS